MPREIVTNKDIEKDMSLTSDVDKAWLARLKDMDLRALGKELEDAATQGHAGRVRHLLDERSGMFRKSFDREVLFGAVMGAAGADSVDCLKLLFDAGASYKPQGYWSGRPMAKAAGNGATKAVQFLLEKGSGVDDGYYTTPIVEAAKNGHLEMVKMLHAHGSKYFHSVLEYAAKGGHLDIVKYAVEQGQKPTASHVKSAAMSDDPAVLKWFFENCPDLFDAKIKSVALKESAGYGKTDNLDFMLENGFSPDRDALVAACTREGVEILEKILEHGAFEQDDFAAALGVAVANGKMEAARICVDRGALNDAGAFVTMIQQAQEKEKPKMTAFLKAELERRLAGGVPANDAADGDEKVDDVTLARTQKLSDMTIRTIFNFKSRQVTTVCDRGYGEHAMAVTVQNFSDVEGGDAIADAHRKLVALGGAPGDYMPAVRKLKISK